MNTRPIDPNTLPANGAILIPRDRMDVSGTPVIVDHAIPERTAVLVLPHDGDDIELAGDVLLQEWREVVGDDAEALRRRYWPESLFALMVVDNDGKTVVPTQTSLGKTIAVNIADRGPDAALEMIAREQVNVVLVDFAADGLRVLEEIRTRHPGVRRFLVPAGIFALGYYSLGFLLVKAHALGFGVSGVVLLYALFNTTCVIAAPLAGLLGDRIGRSRIVLLGYALYGLVNLGMLAVDERWQLVVLFALYGVFYAIEESQSRAFITDLEPQRRATAIGLYNLVTGALYLPASLIAGVLWTLTPAAAFARAAGLSTAAMLAFIALRPAGTAP